MNPTLALSEPTTVEILSGASLSAAVNLGGRIPAGVYMPATWTAAGLTFEVSPDGSTYYPLEDIDGNEYTATVVASVYVAFDTTKFFGARYMKVRSGTSAAAVNQGADRTLTLALTRPITR